MYRIYNGRSFDNSSRKQTMRERCVWESVIARSVDSRIWSPMVVVVVVVLVVLRWKMVDFIPTNTKRVAISTLGSPDVWALNSSIAQLCLSILCVCLSPILIIIDYFGFHCWLARQIESETLPKSISHWFDRMFAFIIIIIIFVCFHLLFFLLIYLCQILVLLMLMRF